MKNAPLFKLSVYRYSSKYNKPSKFVITKESLDKFLKSVVNEMEWVEIFDNETRNSCFARGSDIKSFNYKLIEV